MNTTPELLVVMPVYNESASINHVLGGWLAELELWMWLTKKIARVELQPVGKPLQVFAR
jgi:hypothetical protein